MNLQFMKVITDAHSFCQKESLKIKGQPILPHMAIVYNILLLQ